MVKKYKIYIDENLPSQLAKGLNELQKPQNIRDGFELEILSIKDVFGQGEQDEDWIPKVGSENGIVITQDFRIQTQRHQKELYIQSGIGILFLKPPSNNGFTYWEMVKKKLLMNGITSNKLFEKTRHLSHSNAHQELVLKKWNTNFILN